MNRKEFLRTAALGAAALVAGPSLTACAAPADKKKKKGAGTELKISSQWGTAPGGSLAEKLDWMEQNGIVGFEPGGGDLPQKVTEYQNLLQGRNIKISAICAGFRGFILAEDPATKAEFDSSMRDIIAAAGELGSTGVIMVPAFNWQNPCKPHTWDTRQYLVEQLAELGDYALKHNTTIILEPLNRGEAFYLRQVADAAAICQDTKCAGVKCMGDFWHMTPEETSDYGALWSGGEYLQHMHIASRGRRIMPGEDGELDNYVDGFRALKEINYQGYVSFECGTKGDLKETSLAALELMRRQWDEA
jgi:sugar phosphate isomerase/epimerase